MRIVHVVHLLIGRAKAGKTAFLVYPHEKWSDSSGQPFLTLPTKHSVTEPFGEFDQGRPLDDFVDSICQIDLGLQTSDFVLEQELEVVEFDYDSPTQRVATRYLVYPVNIWVAPQKFCALADHVNGLWLTCDEALDEPRISPTAQRVFKELCQRREQFSQSPPSKDNPRDQSQAAALERLFDLPSDQPTMDGLALKWFSQSRQGVRHIAKVDLDRILDAGNRAFNLRVADPYLPYHKQGLGFTWSFFTHKDKQDCHVHGAPVVEIYGILEGRMEIWYKPYYDRGTSAWYHRELGPGDWLEVDSLQCHIVHWLTEGKGIVFKAGPGPLAEVGKLGVKGKTPCTNCSCMKPPQVVSLEIAQR